MAGTSRLPKNKLEVAVMGQFLERLHYFSRPREPFSDGWGEVRAEARQWEDGYRNR